MAVKRIDHTKPTSTISVDLKGGKEFPKPMSDSAKSGIKIPLGAQPPAIKHPKKGVNTTGKGLPKTKVKWDTSLSGAHV
jgi:hypothetical protein